MKNKCINAYARKHVFLPSISIYLCRDHINIYISSSISISIYRYISASSFLSLNPHKTVSFPLLSFPFLSFPYLFSSSLLLSFSNSGIPSYLFLFNDCQAANWLAIACDSATFRFLLRWTDGWRGWSWLVALRLEYEI